MNYNLWIKRNITSLVNMSNRGGIYCGNCRGAGYITCNSCSKGCWKCDDSTIKKCDSCNGTGGTCGYLHFSINN
mgnify:CR=1 FL=1